MKPTEYRLAYAVVRAVKYACLERDAKGTLPKTGLLQPGRVVWLKAAPDAQADCMQGYTEGVGVVEVDGRCLRRA